MLVLYGGQRQLTVAGRERKHQYIARRDQRNEVLTKTCIVLPFGGIMMYCSPGRGGGMCSSPELVSIVIVFVLNPEPPDETYATCGVGPGVGY